MSQGVSIRVDNPSIGNLSSVRCHGAALRYVLHTGLSAMLSLIRLRGLIRYLSMEGSLFATSITKINGAPQYLRTSQTSHTVENV